MDNDTRESGNTNGNYSFYRSSIVFTVHMKAGYVFGSRRDNVLVRLNRADPKEIRNQVITANKQVAAGIVAEFNQAFTDNAEIAFGSRTYQCGDIEKIEISDGGYNGKDYLYTTVVNPNI